MRDWLQGVTVADAAAHLGVTRFALSRMLNHLPSHNRKRYDDAADSRGRL